MKQAYGISGGALAAALLGMLFCIWTALGNEVAFCVTTGCSLYQDLVIGGLSMWWIGTAAFGVLACQKQGGRQCAAGDAVGLFHGSPW